MIEITNAPLGSPLTMDTLDIAITMDMTANDHVTLDVQHWFVPKRSHSAFRHEDGALSL